MDPTQSGLDTAATSPQLRRNSSHVSRSKSDLRRAGDASPSTCWRFVGVGGSAEFIPLQPGYGGARRVRPRSYAPVVVPRCTPTSLTPQNPIALPNHTTILCRIVDLIQRARLPPA